MTHELQSIKLISRNTREVLQPGCTLYGPDHRKWTWNGHLQYNFAEPIAGQNIQVVSDNTGQMEFKHPHVFGAELIEEAPIASEKITRWLATDLTVARATITAETLDDVETAKRLAAELDEAFQRISDAAALIQQLATILGKIQFTVAGPTSGPVAPGQPLRPLK